MNKEKKIQIAFYKGQGSPISKTIKYITNSNYSHTEIIIGKYWYGANIDIMNKSMITKIEKPKEDPEDWDVFDIMVDKKQYKSIVSDLDSFVGADYNFSGLIKYLIGYNISGNDKFICSEFAAFILIKNKVLKMKKAPLSYDPGMLYNEIENKFRYTVKDKLSIMKSKLTGKNISKEEIYIEW